MDLMDFSDDEYYSDSEGGYVPYEGYAREADDLVDKMLADPEDPNLDSHRLYDEVQSWSEHYCIDEGDRWGYDEYEGIPAVERSSSTPSAQTSAGTHQRGSGSPVKRKAPSRKKDIDPHSLDKVAVLKDWKKRLKEGKDAPASSLPSPSHGEAPARSKAKPGGSAKQAATIKGQEQPPESGDIEDKLPDAGASKQGQRK